MSFITDFLDKIVKDLRLRSQNLVRVKATKTDCPSTAEYMRAFRRTLSTRSKPSQAAPATGAISLENINSHVKNASYAVRGPIVSRAQELAKTR